MGRFERSLACLVLVVAAGCVSSPFGVRPEIQNVGDGGEGRGRITITFEITDDDLTWPSVAVEYRASDGVLRKATLTDASVEGVEARLDPNAGNVMHIKRWVGDWTPCTVTWDSLADGVALDGQDTVTIRLTPSDFDGVGEPEEHTIGVNNHFPTLHVDKTSLSFEYVYGTGQNPPAQVVQVENTGPDLTVLTWSIEAASVPAWLSASPATGTLRWDDPAAAVSFSVDPVGQGLGVNVYEADVTFTGVDPLGADAHGNRFPLHVTLTVREPEPEISIEDSAGAALTDLYFTATGGNPPDQSFFVKNSGEAGSVLAWTATDGPGSNAWLSYSPTSGNTPAGSSAEVAVSVDASGLATGTYTAEITVSAPGGGSEKLTVHLTVGEAPALSVSPATLTFTATEGGANPASQTLSITNAGGGTLDWSVSDGETWLTLSPTSGQCTSETDTVTVSVNITGLTANTYNATITVTAPGAAGSPRSVPVTLVVSGGNRPPSVDLTADPTSGAPPLNVFFDAGSSDADGDTLTHEWDWRYSGTFSADANTGASATASHTYATAAGTYTVAVRVSDGQETVIDTVTITLVQGPVAWWKFDETSGQTAYDSSGNGNDGTLANGPSWTSGQIAGGLSFDGVDDYVQADSTHWSQLTFSLWVNMTSGGPSGAPRLIAKNVHLVYLPGGGQLEFAVARSGAAGRWLAPAALVGTGWNHVAVTYDGSPTDTDAAMYLNGVSLPVTETSAPSGTLLNNAGPVGIGNRATLDRPFHGSLDDVRIYNRALSAAEIQALFDLAQ